MRTLVCLLKPLQIRLIAFFIGLPIGLWIIGQSRNRFGLRSVHWRKKDVGTRTPISAGVNLVHKTWPPDDLTDLFRSDLGVYSLSLKPWVTDLKKTNHPRVSHIRLLKALFDSGKINGSNLEKLVWLDTHYRLDGLQPDFQLYPKIMDLRAAVRAIKSGKPTNEHPIYDPELLVIETVNMSCGDPENAAIVGQHSHDCDLVVMVKSCISCQSKRAHARSTYMQKHLWNGLKVEFLFVIGLPFIANSSRWKVEDVEVFTRGQAANETQLKQQRYALFNESNVYKDILVGGFNDNYHNLTTKLIFTFRWASAFCKYCAPIFLYMDDDISVVPEAFVKLVKKLPKDAKREIIGGLPNTWTTVDRPSVNLGLNRHAVTRKSFPWNRLPTFFYGAGYILGSERLLDAAIATAYVKFLKMDDVYLGIIWDKLDYKCIKLPGFKLRLTSALDIENIALTWSKIIDPHVNWKTGRLLRTP
ncbi:unnamed protein product [Calicophoron daubneyi]|uniref:Hexosyltransferase n=1 Tax=Calicophoron daubneyi TaxID=300641 RepID=A0AAV2TFH8_CALDB